jgi:hypothetical protein
VELPNGTYGIVDTIESHCQQCSTEAKEIEIVENPKWELVTDNNLCVLGTLVIGGTLDKDLTSTMTNCNCTPGSAIGCPEPSADGEYQTQAAIGIQRQCGKPPTSPGVGTATSTWHYFISHPLLAAPSDELSNKCSSSIIVPDGKRIIFPNWLTNNEAREKYINIWKSEIEDKYSSKYICSNTHDYNFDQLIEGVVPGTCQLKYDIVNWPITAFKVKSTVSADSGSEGKTTYESEQTSSTLQVLVAYMKYEYRHPLSLQDKMIDTFSKDLIESPNGPSSVCRTYNSIGGPANNCRVKYFGNIKEILSSRETEDSNCKSSPQCYDKSRGCDPNTPCCQFDIGANTYKQV